MSVPHASVCKAFATMAKDLSPPDPRIKAQRVFIDGRCLYSYGHHHVIARVTRRGEAIVNTKKVSSSTSRHTSTAIHELRAAGVRFVTQDFSVKGDKPPPQPERRAIEL